MTKTDTRPKFDANGKFDEETARWLFDGVIRKIEYDWEMTGADTSRDWIVFHRDTGDKRNFPSNFLNDGFGGYFNFSPSSRGLIRPNYAGEQLRKQLDAIDEWEETHAKERAEYDRLKAKFEP